MISVLHQDGRINSKHYEMTPFIKIQPVLMSRDVKRSIVFFGLLGFQKIFTDDEEDPKYAGVARDGIELHLQWHDSKEWDFPIDRPTYRFVVKEIDQLFQSFVEAGVQDYTQPQKTPWGTYEFHVRDPDMNGLQFYRADA